MTRSMPEWFASLPAVVLDAMDARAVGDLDLTIANVQELAVQGARRPFRIFVAPDHPG